LQGWSNSRFLSPSEVSLKGGMPMADSDPKGQCGSAANVLDAVGDTVVVSFKVLDRTITDLPAFLAKPQVKKVLEDAVKDAITDMAKKRVDVGVSWFSPTVPPPPPSPEQVAKDIVSKGATGLVTEALNEAAQQRELQDQAKKLVDALKCSPMGVWFDKNSSIVYIVAAGMVVGGVMALYLTDVADPVAGPLLSLGGGKEVKTTFLGNIELGATIPKFSNDSKTGRTIETKVFATANWQKVQVKFDVAVKEVRQNVAVTSTGQVLFRLPNNNSVVLKGGGSAGTDKNYWVGFGMDFNVGKSVSLGLGVTYGTQPGAGPVPPGLFDQGGGQPASGNSPPAWEAFAKVKVNF
jgi:hypothetical protein